MTSYPTLLGTGGHTPSGQVIAETYYYGNVGLGRCPMYGAFSVDANLSQTIRTSGAISYLSWGLDEAFESLDGTLTLTLNVGGSPSDLVVSFDSMTTGWQTDSTDSVSVSSGDSLCFAADYDMGTSTYDGSFYCVSARFDATTASAQMFAAVSSGIGFTPNNPGPTQNFINFLGILNTNIETEDTTEHLQQYYCLVSGTWKNMALYLESNTLTGSATFNSQINGTNGAMAISILDTITSGYFENGSDEDSVSVGDHLNYAFSTSATSGEILIDWIGAQFVATYSNLCMIGGTPSTPFSMFPVIDTNATAYSSLFGGGDENGNPARATGLFPYALSASMYTNHVIESGAAATFNLLKNGSTSGLAVSASSGETGYLMTPPVSIVDFAVGNSCVNQIVVGETGTSITWDGAALLLTASS